MCNTFSTLDRCNYYNHEQCFPYMYIIFYNIKSNKINGVNKNLISVLA